MNDEGLTAGRDALARAMDVARKSSRAAKVMALVVPLAALAAQQAHAIIVESPSNGTQSFNLPSGSGGYSQSGSVTWTVTHNSGSYQYSVDFDVTSSDFYIDGVYQGASGLTEVDIPYNLNKVQDLEVNGFGVGTGEFTFSYLDGISDLSAAGFLNPFDITFNSDVAPVLATYDIDGSGGGSGSVGFVGVDPPIPGVPVPEPGTLSLFGMALVGLGALRRRLTG